ncbi:MAG: helix-turn-helix domain-containing protein [Candidatus Aminicenantes bacterium]|nr:helix-turn-helix domain-containing protein [Candidatus Aminicenantes bacterium]NIM79535.1 helix-turn-helix domain-containing protein [Candidatus Aminicenantes bacterium]NIN18849.1 helix-turn-helix domain-containing protein [Candidatus Aminicenantes bacterium]NIN42762.1 helix-turn-helix domain-containing protein [Candidatus Aminicenantes bacterium]NIN85489.1 helix-turn-helix domain-containing protein [Candidatus Aminicenantes bacterium]
MESFKRNMSREIGLKLKKLREQEGWSKTEMASRLGVTPSGYGKNEKGVNTPGIVTLQRLRERFDLTMDWLFFDEGPRTRQEKKKRETQLEQELEELKRELAAQREAYEQVLEEKTRQDKEWQEKAAALELKPEVKELLEQMVRIPMLYYQIMLSYQKFKVENKELVEMS